MINIIRKYILGLSLIFVYQLTAQNEFAIVDVTLFNGAEISENVTVQVVDGKIENIGIDIETKGLVLDGRGKFLMPALINAHVHCWMPAQLEEAAKAGVLTLLDMHGLEPMQQFMVNERNTPGKARFYRAGYAATAHGGHGTQYGFSVPVLEKPEDATQWVNDRVKADVDHIKIILEPWKNTLDYDTVRAIVNEAHKQNKVAVVHVSKKEDAFQAFEANANGLVHIWTDGSISDDRLSKMAASKNFFVTPTLLTNILVQEAYFNKSKEETQQVEKMLLQETKRLYEAGISLLAGTDPPNANINMGTDLYKELVYLSKAGIPNVEVLKTATSHPADHYELENFGYLKKGFVADMILLDKNPIQDIQHIATIHTIWKAGVKVE